MKRAVPQDANSVPLSGIDTDATEDHPRQTLPEDNRRVCTSAAMIGLAISVGAYGLLSPQKGDKAIAAEPTPTSDAIAGQVPPAAVEPMATASVPSAEGSAVALPAVGPTVAETVAESVTIASASQPGAIQPTTIAYTVQEGQTLWKIAELYGIDAAKLASANSLQVNAVLDVGQVLQVPVSTQAIIPQANVKQMPALKQVPSIPAITVAMGPSTSDAPPALNAQATPKSQQVGALQGLKQNRDRLKQSLAELKSEESKPVAQALPAVEISTVEAQPEATASNLSLYQVQGGETLSSIAQAHGVSMTELVKLNHLSNPNLLKANQFIRVPQATVAAQPGGMSAPTTANTDRSAVVVPVVASLAATQNVDSASVPLAVGGDAQQFAFNRAGSKTSNTDSGTSEVGSQGSAPYVSSLMSEIVRLREKYQSRSTAQNWKPVAKAATPNLFAGSSRRVNPEFKSSRQLASLRPESRSANQANRSAGTKMEALLANAPQPKQQLVATSSLGSESYTPLVRSQIGKAVSPNVPPLGKSDSYLPGASDRFKGYMWPAKGILTSGYGWRWGRMHKGIDIAAPVGTSIVAAAPGKVVSAGWNDGGYGNLVEIEHSDGSVTLYGHNSRVLVKVGQQVAQGQQIALMGSTGYSTGPHSHFEVHLPGRGAVNPIAYLPQSRG